MCSLQMVRGQPRRQGRLQNSIPLAGIRSGRNGQTQVFIPLIEHQSFVHHHAQEGPYLFFTEAGKIRENLRHGSARFAEAVNLSGCTSETVGHVMAAGLPLADDHEIKAILE